MRALLTEMINLAADDFKKLAESGNAADIEYQDKIKGGLQRFADNSVSLDTDDMERVCSYFQEHLDIVGLESSEGLLNNFRYVFDPTEKWILRRKHKYSRIKKWLKI